MRDLCRDIDSQLSLRENIQVLGEAFPSPRHAFGERRAGNILDALHQLDQPLMVARLAGREADPAIADDRGGDTVLR